MGVGFHRLRNRLPVAGISARLAPRKRPPESNPAAYFKVMLPDREALPTRSTSTTGHIIFLYVVKGHDSMTSYAAVAPIMPLTYLNLVGVVGVEVLQDHVFRARGC